MPCKNPPPSWSSLRRTWGTWGPKALQFVRTCGIPGMKVMVFAFDPVGESAYLPPQLPAGLRHLYWHP